MTNTTDPRTMAPSEVQHFLNGLGIGETFNIIFLTSKGEQRAYKGYLDKGNAITESVAFLTDMEGYKRFNINQVLSIGVGP